MIWNRNTPPAKILLLFFIISLAYAVVRYQIFGGVSWDQLPLFVMNKVFALTIILLLFYKIRYAKALSAERKEWYSWAIGGLVSGHVLISLSLLSPEYYASFFNTGKMHFKNELSILFGIATLIAFMGSLLASMKGNSTLAGKLQQTLLFLLAVHLFSMGFSSWIEPSKWQGSMPPISLLSFALLVAILFPVKRLGKQ